MNRVISVKPDPQTARSYWTMNRRDSARAFQAARRHSRMVRILRVALPVAVVLAFAVITLTTYFNPLRNLGDLPANVSRTVVHGSKITMEQPKLSGFTRDGRAYNLVADSAAQDVTKPDIIELNNIHAQIEMQDKSTVRMSALRGVYNSKSEILNLTNDIRLNSSSGYTGRLSQARVNIKKGDVFSDRPVGLKMLHGTLVANRMQIVQSGDLIRFDRGVEMTVMLTGENVVKPTHQGPVESGTANGAQ